jgi:hypothetical protein
MSRALRRSILALALLGAVVPPVAVSGAEACASGHLGLRWGNWREPIKSTAYPQFYWAAENEASVTVTVEGVGHDCTVPKQPVTGTYEVRDYPQEMPAETTAVADYQPILQGSTGPLYGSDGPPPTEHAQEVLLTQDLLPEAVAEQAQAIITFSSGTNAIPWDTPLHVIDDDGLSRVAFNTGERRDHSETYPSLFVAVLRAGPADATESFPFTVEGSGTVPAGAEDFEMITPSPLEFAAGERVKLIEIGIVNDAIAESSEELTVTLTEPGPLIPEARDAMAAPIRILDNEEGGTGTPPSTKFHHPRQRLHYERGDYRLREFHVFANDDEGEVARVEIAVRQNRVGGGCAWLTGERFARGACSAKRWLETEYLQDLDWYYYRMDQLKPSEGTTIKSYTAFARGTDGAGNVESRFETGRNANTFEVEKKR